MDSPHRQRPLAGVDQALGEGHARQPTELLDQLRDRLSRLDANHPSASPPPADQARMGIGDEADAAEEANTGREAEPVTLPDDSAAATHQSPDRETGGRDASRRGRSDSGRAPERASGEDLGSPTGSSSSADETSRAWSDDVSASGSTPDQGPFETGPGWGRRPGSGEPYRPWFAGDEPITPWFAE